MICRFSGLLSLALTTVVISTKTATVYATPAAVPPISATESSIESADQEIVVPIGAVRELQTVVPSLPFTAVGDPVTAVPTLTDPVTAFPTLTDPVTAFPTLTGPLTVVPTAFPTTPFPTLPFPTSFPTVVDFFSTTIFPTVIENTFVPSVICTDDPDFRISGDEEKDCNYVAKNNKEVRCTRPGVSEACRATCDPECPTSRPTSQPIPSSSPTSLSSIDCVDEPDYRVNGRKKQSCEWVAKRNTQKRCDLGGNVEAEKAKKFCRLTCNPACEPPPGPTTAPTFKPSVEPPCKDVEEFVINGNVRNCDWAEKFESVRCKRTTESGIKVSDVCPSVCDRRCTCTNADKIFPFGNKKRTCKLILKRQGDCLKKAGRKKIVADFCPRKCDDCYPVGLRNKKRNKKRKKKSKQNGKKKRKKGHIII